MAVYPHDPAEDEEITEETDPPPPWHRLPDGCTIFTLTILAAGLLSQLVAVFFGMLAFVFCLGVTILAGLLLLPMMLAMVRAIRDRHRWSSSLLWLIVILLMSAVFWLV